MLWTLGEGPSRGLLCDCTTGCGIDGALHSTSGDTHCCCGHHVGQNFGRVVPDEAAAGEAGEAEDAAGDAEEEGDDGEGDVRGEGEVVVHPEEEHEGE